MLSQTCEFSGSNSYISLDYADLINHFDLLVFSAVVILFKAIKLLDESVNFRSVLRDGLKTLILNFLLFELNLLVLILQISELLLKSSEVSLTASQLRNIGLKL